MPHFDWKILLLLLLAFACQNEQSIDRQYVVSVKQASLRAEPDQKSLEIRSLLQGQTLVDLDEVSSSETQVVMGEDIFQTPWIKVKTDENEVGWVLAWALSPTRNREDWLLQKRLACYFGKNLTVRRNALVKSLPALQAEDQLFNFWMESKALRDTFLTILRRRPELGFQPSFNWLNDGLPGFLYQKVGVSEMPYLFADFVFWQQLALKTNGLQDDAYFQTCLVAFQQDSIESFFPSWKFQISDSESASQLGTGRHLEMLQQIDRAMQAGPVFALLLSGFKDQVLEDIFGKNIQYWQPREKILKELDRMLDAAPQCLDAREREALGIRRRMFENPEENGIVVNLRGG